jgi:apolipoprotein N-acyltransferase
MNVKGRLGASIGDVRDRGKRVAQLTLQLAAAELKRKAVQFGAAFGLLGAAALFGFFFLAFLLAAVAAALALVLPVWAALLITAGLLLSLIVVLVLVGVGLVRTAKTPVPTQAVEEARADAVTFREGIRALARRKARTAAAPAADHVDQVATAQEPLSTSPGGTDGQG